MSPPTTPLVRGTSTPIDFDVTTVVADLCEALGQNDSLGQGKDFWNNSRYIAASWTTGLGTDEQKVFRTLRQIGSQAELDSVQKAFLDKTGLSLKESLTRDLSAGELGTALGLIEFWSADTELNLEKFTLSRSEKEATTQKIKNIEAGWNLAYGVTGAVVALAASSAVLATAPLSVPLAIGAIAAGTAAGFTAESLVMMGGNAIRGRETTKEDYVDALGTAFTSSLGLGMGRGIALAFEKGGTKLAQALIQKGMTEASAGKTAEIFSRYGGAITTNEAIGYANTGILEHRLASKEEAALWGIFGLATGAIRPWMNVNRTREISGGIIQETAENEVETLLIQDRDGDGLADGDIRTEDHIAGLQGAFTELGGHIRAQPSTSSLSELTQARDLGFTSEQFLEVIAHFEKKVAPQEPQQWFLLKKIFQPLVQLPVESRMTVVQGLIDLAGYYNTDVIMVIFSNPDILLQTALSLGKESSAELPLAQKRRYFEEALAAHDPQYAVTEWRAVDGFNTKFPFPIHSDVPLTGEQVERYARILSEIREALPDDFSLIKGINISIILREGGYAANVSVATGQKYSSPSIIGLANKSHPNALLHFNKGKRRRISADDTPRESDRKYTKTLVGNSYGIRASSESEDDRLRSTILHEMGHLVAPSHLPYYQALFTCPYKRGSYSDLFLFNEIFAEDYRIFFETNGQSVMNYSYAETRVPFYEERLKYFKTYFTRGIPLEEIA